MPERDHLQCDPTSIQTKNGRGGVNLIYGKPIELESVTPSKLCVTILLRNYIIDLKSEPQNDAKPFEFFRPANTRTCIFGDNVDEVAPWQNMSKSVPLKNEIEENSQQFSSARRRRNFCVLAIKLIQGIDMPLQELFKMIDSSAIKDKWKEDMAQILEEGVGGLMNLTESLEKMVSPEKRRPEEQNLPYIHRTSVVGLFFRRIILCFDKLNFSEVSHLYHNYRQFCEADLAQYFEAEQLKLGEMVKTTEQAKNLTDITTPRKVTLTNVTSTSSSLPTTSTPDLEISSLSEEVLKINHQNSNLNLNLPSGLTTFAEADATSANKRSTHIKDASIPNRLTRTQAELYIANQVELLQTSEANAHSPEQIDLLIQAILRDNPDLSQAYFLSYLNCLRIKDYCEAINNLRKCFSGASVLSNKNPVDYLQSGSLANIEDTNRGYRYAALNIAALHARFSHKEEAAAALREAIMMAQESNDHICLQHALSWLYRIQPETERLKLIERCISKSQELNLSYLQSLGEQALSLFTAMVGLSDPSAVMDILTRSDMLNCKHSITELVTSSYSQKSAFWSMYGRSHMSSTVSQLLLNLDNTGNQLASKRNGDKVVYATGEATAISISNLIRHLHDQGKEKLVDKLIRLAKLLFSNESSMCGEIWRYTSLQVEFERAMYETNWPKASSTIVEAEAFCSVTTNSPGNSDSSIPLETLFMRLQLNIYRGDAAAASNIRQTIFHALTNAKESIKLTPHQHVRLLLFDVEIACMTSSYQTAIPPLLKAASICDKNNLEFHRAIIALHTAHVQLHFGLLTKALHFVKKALPIVLSHGSLFECGRAKLLFAKCLVAAANRVNVSKGVDEHIQTCEFTSEGRMDVQKAKELLQSANKNFLDIGAYSRAKDVLYLKARLAHTLGHIQERNQISAEFKKLEEQHPSHSNSVLASML